MTSLITILISLLGYGSPSDYETYTEAQLEAEIVAAESSSTSVEAVYDDGYYYDDDEENEGGGWDDWDTPGVIGEP